MYTIILDRLQILSMENIPTKILSTTPPPEPQAMMYPSLAEDRTTLGSDLKQLANWSTQVKHIDW